MLRPVRRRAPGPRRGGGKAGLSQHPSHASESRHPSHDIRVTESESRNPSHPSQAARTPRRTSSSRRRRSPGRVRREAQPARASDISEFRLGFSCLPVPGWTRTRVPRPAVSSKTFRFSPQPRIVTHRRASRDQAALHRGTPTENLHGIAPRWRDISGIRGVSESPAGLGYISITGVRVGPGPPRDRRRRPGSAGPRRRRPRRRPRP